MKKRLGFAVVRRGLLFTICCVSPTLAGSHLWRINEIFSNADGTVQFIELKECCGATGETALAGKPLISVATGHTFVFPSNIPGNTANKHLLIATPAFAALPGAPTPNFFFSQVPFFNANADTIDWAPLLNYDEFTFSSGQLPTDGINAIRITNYTTDTFVTEANTPTNYLGQSGSVDASVCVDNDGDGYGDPASIDCTFPELDCDDTNDQVHPGATELCHDLVDNDCNNMTDCGDPACDNAQGCVPAMGGIGAAFVLGSLLTMGAFVFRRVS